MLRNAIRFATVAYYSRETLIIFYEGKNAFDTRGKLWWAYRNRMQTQI